MGYRRIRDELDRHHDIDVNDKRILRICRKEHIQSTIKWKPKSCTRNSNDPAHIANNYLNRDFHADAPNKKWLTDVTEFKYYIGIEVHKVYLSAILDLYDRRIVAYKIGEGGAGPRQVATEQGPQEAILKELSKHEPRNQQAISMELSSDESCCSTGNNQARDQAGITQLSWQLSSR